MNYTDIPILMYHEISELDNPWCVTPENFAQQMSFLQEQGYKTISLTQLREGLEVQKEVTEKLIAITFDDGRKGVYDFAFPTLQKYGFTAMVYVVPDWVEGKYVPLLEQYSAFMNWQELQELHKAGWEIGSHSCSHQNLVSLSQDSVQGELQRAEDFIRQNCGNDVRHFSYPFGEYTPDVLKMINSRYDTAVTMAKGFVKSPGNYARQGIMRETSLPLFTTLLRRPRISLSMIVKNEEQFLGVCLQSVQGVVDEIIIVDTGSTDGTKTIAGKFTDKIYDFTWCEDFAAARNEALHYAAGDWILCLDADEVLDQKDQALVLDAVNNRDISAYRFMTRNYSNESSISGWIPVLSGDAFAQSFSGWYPSLKVRLFQRDEKIKFAGKVHELVDDAVEHAGGKIASLPVSVHHYGALKGNKQDKLIHHLQLQQQKIRDDSQNAKAYFELGVQQLHLGQFMDAEKALVESLRLDSEPLPPLLHLALVQQKQGNYDVAFKTYQHVLLKNPQSADAHFGQGFCHFKKEDLEKAAASFHQAITHNPLLVDAYINLGAVYERLEKYPEAAEMLRTAAQLSPRQPRVYYNMGVIQEKLMNILMAIGCYEQAIKLHYVRREELQDKVARMKKFMEESEAEEGT